MWSVAAISRAADVTIAWLEQAGVRLPISNRLTRARDTLSRYLQVPWYGLPSEHHEVVCEATRTILELYLVVRGMRRAAHVVAPELQSLLRGADLPQERGKTYERDMQFELAMGTLLEMGGVAGVSRGEPDWRVKAGTFELGIAVKRLSSGRNRLKRVKAALDQIRRHGIPAILIANLDRIVDARTERDIQKSVIALVCEFKGLADRHNERLTSASNAVVLGIVGFVSTFEPFDVADTGGLRMNLHFHAEFIADSPVRVEVIRHKLGILGANAIRDLRRALSDTELGRTPTVS